jgi:tRNA(adenine34) deaminase
MSRRYAASALAILYERAYNDAITGENMLERDDTYFMKEALKEARKAFDNDEVPVGAIVVHKGTTIIGRAHNQAEMLHDATAHAEMLAITQAAEFLENWRLLDCTLYVTIEPCMMCCGAMVLSRLPLLVYGADDPKHGSVTSIAQSLANLSLNHKVKIVSGVMQKECAAIMADFFQKLRKKNKGNVTESQ